jgi:hypothetical protein
MADKIDFLILIGVILYGMYRAHKMIERYYRYESALKTISRMRGYETSKGNGPWTIAKGALGD